ncbi:unnamed protein product [Trichogramma brassicae]|uniref:Uncharacterized protein n=1 Tax=Trichogramma brassicae TaxID=86971 RepID=A0A6H5IVY7_9HYME|nr:unnamed protein product [Trichogramma brassicae]
MDVELLKQAGLSSDDAEQVIMACYKCSRTEYPAPPPEPERLPLPELLRDPWERRARSRSPRGREEATTSSEPTRPRIVSEVTGKGLIDVIDVKRILLSLAYACAIRRSSCKPDNNLFANKLKSKQMKKVQQI